MNYFFIRLFRCFLALTPTLLLAQSDQALSDPSASASLHAFFEKQWEIQMEQNPVRASLLGDRRWNNLWPDLGPKALEQQHESHQTALTELRQFRRGELNPSDQLNYDLFEKDYLLRLEQFPFRWHLIPLNQRGGIQTSDELADALRFETEQDYADWIARLRNFPVYMDQTIALMKDGIRSGMLLPRIVMERVPNQIAQQIVADPRESPFFKPFKNFPDSLPGKDRERLKTEATAAITEHILPAYKKFQTFFNLEYLPASYENVGAWQMPDGPALYAFFARKFTTTDLSPDQIHQIGLDEVKRIRREMDRVLEQLDFNGSLAEFFEFLRTDPRFYFDSPEELLAAYRAMSKEIDPLMVKLFRTFPRIPYGVEPIPDKIAPDTTTAYYRPPASDGTRAGAYFVNLYKPETRPKYEMMALSLHEAVPGHHFQIALAMELGELPKFRRYGGYTAYVEGWGLYAEHLGEELGLYGDPYSKFGQLTYEMWRAVRLVVDTGMHHHRWDRDRAITFFKENAPKSENDIINEIDRYIAWPGQALAYKIGELKIKELRARATDQLGDNFDPREFHDVVLLSGAIPLDVLEQKVNAWIRSKK